MNKQYVVVRMNGETFERLAVFVKRNDAKRMAAQKSLSGGVYRVLEEYDCTPVTEVQKVRDSLTEIGDVSEDEQMIVMAFLVDLATVHDITDDWEELRDRYSDAHKHVTGRARWPRYSWLVRALAMAETERKGGE